MIDPTIAAKYRAAQGCAPCASLGTLCPSHIDEWTTAGSTR